MRAASPSRRPGVTAGGWYRADWGPLGMAETVVKGAAFLIAYTAFGRAAGSALAWPSGSARIEVVLLGLVELALLAAIWDRVVEREVTAFVFVLANNAAHLGLIWALCTERGAGDAVWVFAGLMLIGELVKIAFLRITGFTVRGHPTGLLIALTSIGAALYAVVAVVAVIA